jgi:hypothetical protein
MPALVHRHAGPLSIVMPAKAGIQCLIDAAVEPFYGPLAAHVGKGLPTYGIARFITRIRSAVPRPHAAFTISAPISHFGSQP